MNDKNWIGNQRSIFATLGASNHVDEEREMNDYYATDPDTIKALLEVEEFNNDIWECAVGEGHIKEVLKNYGYNVFGSDIVERNNSCDSVIDFLNCHMEYEGDIITNPPYKFAKEFVEKSLDLVGEGNRVAMLLKLQFLEGQKRRELFDNTPPKYVYVFSARQQCGKNGEFYKKDKNGNVEYDTKGNPKRESSAVAYAWFIWEKGCHSETIIRWI